jgi:murein DD-endopeptidase MepM/ murein hydrolase activator NlpD
MTRIVSAARRAAVVAIAAAVTGAACGGDPTGAPRAFERAPLEEWVVLQPFGVHNRNWNGYHLATDLLADAGTPVYAAGGGRVLFAATGVTGYGGIVLIRHSGPGPLVTSLYGHLSARRGLRVSAGEIVAAGLVVGTVADDDETGGPWVPHLHFGVHRGSPSVDDDSVCGLWPYIGYTRSCSGWTHEQVRALWYDPATLVPGAR